jgi:molecular chaperone DnaK (HSP70)
MNKGVFFGIDIGTSSCSVAYVVDDPRYRDRNVVEVRTVDIPVDEHEIEKRSSRMPSLIALDWDDRRRRRPLFGWNVFRLLEKERSLCQRSGGGSTSSRR